MRASCKLFFLTTKPMSRMPEAKSNLQGMEMLLLVGLNRNLPKDRVDMLVGCDGGDIYKYGPTIESLLKDCWPNGNFSACDDSVRFELPTGCGGIAVCNSTELVGQIQKWTGGKELGGQHRPWATGYWVPEALCGDLATAESLHDPKRIHYKIKELITPYPSLLSRAISKLCIEEIKQKLNTLEKLHEGEDLIEFNLCLSDIASSLVRLAFARSCCYFRGFRSLAEQAHLLESSSLPVYKLALRFSRFTPKDTEEVSIVIGEIGKLLAL